MVVDEKIKNQIKEIIHKVTRIEKDKIIDSAYIRNDLFIDSLQAIQIASIIEEKFLVEINEIEILNIDTIQEIYQILEEL